jgi:drug/metabolite transporter (DMT)-like permease
VVCAAVLWSLSGGFTKVLREPTFLHLDEPRPHALLLAFYRALFAALFLLPTLQRREICWRPAMAGMTLCFAGMNVCFVVAMALGPAANAIWLQYTAPLWVYLAGRVWFGERAEWRSALAVCLGVAGVGVIVARNWAMRGADELGVIALALASGITYAGVLIWLRVLRGAAGNWLTFLNLAASAVVLLPFLWGAGVSLAVTPAQAVCLFLFGSVQMALPYLLMARALRDLSPSEAATLTLLEPLLNPVWAYLLSPATETPSWPTVVGGAIIGAALVARYWPREVAAPEGRRKNSPGWSAAEPGENRTDKC